jgi:tetratricopeptide (TPR) repeat protein
VAIHQKLSDESPADTVLRDSLATSLVGLGHAVRLVGRPAEAKAGYERAIALLEPVVQQKPTREWYKEVLASAILGRGLILRDLGDRDGASADARRALALCDRPPPRSVSCLLQRAACHAMLAGLAGQAGSGVPATEGEEEAARAVEALRQVIAMGYLNPNQLRMESALDPLRGRDDFKLLMMDLAFPSEPWAGAE